MIAVGLLATVLSMGVQALATGSRGAGTVRNLTTALNIARSQAEYTLNDDYCIAPCSYTTIDVPDTYSVTAEAEEYPGADSNLQYVVITAYKDGRTLEEFTIVKANR